MGQITVLKARKILGKLAENISDEELEKDIKVAEILKSVYFSNSSWVEVSKNTKSNNGKK